MNIVNLKLGLLRTNCFIVYNESSTCWIIDPGDEFSKIETELNKFELTPTKILLTHGHFDHIEAINDIKNKYPTVKVFIHKNDIPFLTNNETWEMYLGRPLKSTAYDELLLDNQLLEGDNLQTKVIHTPGHSPGSVCFLFDNTILFSGDTVFACGSIGRTDLWKSSFADMRSSLKRIFSFVDNLIIYPGHGANTTLNDEREYRL
jgi:hydroxyacylglutathione hydrolase